MIWVYAFRIYGVSDSVRGSKVCRHRSAVHLCITYSTGNKGCSVTADGPVGELATVRICK